jgi:hypothetical protein
MRRARPGLQLPDLLRILILRAAREADEVGEQDRYEASLGGRGSGRLERGRRVE